METKDAEMRYELTKAALTGVANRIIISSKGVPDTVMVTDFVSAALAVADEAIARLRGTE